MGLKAVGIVVMIIGLVSVVAYGADDLTLKTEKEKISYVLGVQLGNDVRRQGVDIEPDIMMRGLKDSLSGAKYLLTDQQMSDTMAAFQKAMTSKRAEVMKQAAEKNKKEGDAFLAANKKKEGVVTLPDGLQYKIIKEGKGPMPKINDTVTVNYRGMLVDGTEFDSSYRRSEPLSFPVKGVVKGWTEALQMMKVGSKWQLFIPPELGYGEQGGGPIGPNATLIFDIELLSIK
jgi:FKBP-type peptidyl-prolyl cis-trans isomerase FklB